MVIKTTRQQLAQKKLHYQTHTSNTNTFQTHTTKHTLPNTFPNRLLVINYYWNGAANVILFAVKIIQHYYVKIVLKIYKYILVWNTLYYRNYEKIIIIIIIIMMTKNMIINIYSKCCFHPFCWFGWNVCVFLCVKAFLFLCVVGFLYY